MWARRSAGVFLSVFLGCSTDSFVPPDGGTGDGSAVGDTGVADSRPGDGSTPCTGPSFCAMMKDAGMPPACTDFDESMSIPPSWMPFTYILPPATLSNTYFVSCPSSVRFVIPAQHDAGTGAESLLLATTIGNGTSVTVDLEVLLPNFATTDGVVFLGAAKGNGGNLGYEVAVAHSAMDGLFYLTLLQGAAPGNSTSLPNILTNKWNHMVLSVVFSPTTAGSAKLQYTSTSMTQINSSTLMGINADPSGSTTDNDVVSIGAVAGATSNDSAIEFDNVLISVH